mmetsp:Transcript_5880/g.10482  ORF Transcript_5880/g.10482 Transcript_5880/m.10482 type:complete len:219 (+) Transcript_5880:202-858(+)
MESFRGLVLLSSRRHNISMLGLSAIHVDEALGFQSWLQLRALVNICEKLDAHRSTRDVVFRPLHGNVLTVAPQDLELLLPCQILVEILDGLRWLPPCLFSIHDVEGHLVIQDSLVNLRITGVMPRLLAFRENRRTFRIVFKVWAEQPRPGGEARGGKPCQGPVWQVISCALLDLRPTNRLPKRFSSLVILKVWILFLQRSSNGVEVRFVLARLKERVS